MPVIGRDFLPEENVTPGAHPVALVSEGLWRRQLGALTELGNQQVWLNNKPYAVVGVVPDAVSRMVIVVKVRLPGVAIVTPLSVRSRSCPLRLQDAWASAAAGHSRARGPRS